MPNIELDDEFLQLFYNITNSNIPKNIDVVELKKQLINIVDLLQQLNANAKKPIVSRALGGDPDAVVEEEENNGPAILVIDDLGVITYQLRVLLSQFGLDVDCSQEIYDAVNKFKKRQYAYVIMDLFIPTEREGFILLTELRKMSANSDSKVTIGVITASPRKEIEQQCRARGADFFLEKNNEWQKNLYNIMAEQLKADGYTEDEEDY